MKRKLLAIAVSILLMFSLTVPVYAGPGGGVLPPPIPPIPTSIGLYIAESISYVCEDLDSCKCDYLRPCV